MMESDLPAEYLSSSLAQQVRRILGFNHFNVMGLSEMWFFPVINLTLLFD